jgi:hypothetical protein
MEGLGGRAATSSGWFVAPTRRLRSAGPDIFPVSDSARRAGRPALATGKALPDGWLGDASGRDLDLAAAELGISGG